MKNVFTLVVCILGIYASFLTWGVLQEQMTSQRFGPNGEHFKAPFFIGLMQNLWGFIIGWLYVQFEHYYRSPKSSKKTKVEKSNGEETDQVDQEDDENVNIFSLEVLKPIAIVATTQSISTSVGLSSLEHVDYLLYQLAKSCKLIPVMIVHVGYYKRSFPTYKYIVAGVVTLGVILFQLNGKKKKASDKSGNDEGYLLVGLLYLCCSLLMDGVTNATQDVLFKENKKLKGAHLMAGLNFVSTLLSLVYCIVSGQLFYSFNFISKYPIVLKEILTYAITGAIGQIFIFITLAKFGSLILIMVTVTRKMISMLISVFVFGHELTKGQWIALGLVFGGIGSEALIKLQQDSQKRKEKLKTN